MSDRRIDLDADHLGHGLGRLVIELLDVIRQVLERQALHRLDSGSLSPHQIERLGQALLGLESRFAELRGMFGEAVDDVDSNQRKGAIDAGNREQSAAAE